VSAGQAPPVSPAVRITTVAAVVVVALVALVVSFSHMQTVAYRAGEQWRSWLIPASVDGLIVAASMVLLVRRRAGLAGGWLAWTALLGGVLASLACNVAAAEATVTARLLAAWPPLAFAGAFELLLQQRRSEPVPSSEASPVPMTEDRREVSPVASFRPGGFGTYPASAPVRPGGQSDVALAARPGFAPAVGSPRVGLAAPADQLLTSPTSPLPSPVADRIQPAVDPVTSPATPAEQSAPGAGERAGKPRSDAQLSKAVRDLTRRNGGSPPSQYQLRQALGIGSGRAARLLAELDTTPAAEPVTNGAARKEGTR